MEFLDIEKICRLCLAEKEFDSCSAIQEVKQKYEELTNSELEIHKNLPNNVCEDCWENLKCYHAFREELMENQKKLNEWLRVKFDNPVSTKLFDGGAEETSDLDTFEEKSTPETKDNHKRLMKCDKCDKTFTSSYKFNSHMSSHPLEEKIKCSDCNMQFPFKKSFERHYSHVHAKHNSKSCPYCKKTFKNARSLCNHIARHKPERKIECNQCTKSFFSGDLQRHLRTHKKEKNYMCNICGNFYSQSSALTEHIRKHESASQHQYECDKCKEKFSKKDLLRRHEVECKDKKYVIKPVYKCQVLHCHSNFHSRKNLKKHLETYHNIEIPNFEKTCLECNKNFENIGDYSIHIKTHSCLYVCSICKVRFKSFESLAKHELKHENDKTQRKFKCEQCEACFKTSAHLKQHIGFKHTTDRNFHCPHCNLKFKYNGELRSHLNIHKDNRPYQCRFLNCNANFRKSSTLRIHSQTVHNNNFIYICECNESFEYAKELKTHKSETGHGDGDARNELNSSVVPKISIVTKDGNQTDEKILNCNTN